jgi:cobalt-precorrin-6B (C15)-methyltransferase
MGFQGGPTQDEVMAVSLSRLRLGPADQVVDIGCGTGKVALAMARRAGHVFAIDRREEAIRHGQKQAAAEGIENVTYLQGEAIELLPTLPHLNGAFIGGSRDLRSVLEILSKKVEGPVVVNAVLIKTVARAIETMRTLGIFREALHVQIARSHEIGGSLMFRPIDPVYIIIAECGTCS